MWECVLLKEVCNNSSKMKGHTTTPEVIEVIFVFLLMSWSPAFTFVWPIMFQLVWRTPAWFSTCIYTSKHSGQRSIWQAFIVLATFLLLSDSVSKHICPAVQAICVCVVFFFCLFSLLHVALNLCSEIMFVKLLQRSGRITGVMFRTVATVWRPRVWNAVPCLFSLVVDEVCTGFTVQLLQLWTGCATHQTGRVNVCSRHRSAEAASL